MNLKKLSEQVEVVYDGLDDVYVHLPEGMQKDIVLLLSQLDGLRDILLDLPRDIDEAVDEEEEEVGE